MGERGRGRVLFRGKGRHRKGGERERAREREKRDGPLSRLRSRLSVRPLADGVARGRLRSG